MTRHGTGFTEKTFEFLDGLVANNSREWFDEHRDVWESHVKDPFADLLEHLGERLAGTSLPVRGSAATMFRINRDLRFTDDPRPYSESVSGLLTESGTKAESTRLLYLELAPDVGRVGGGLHQASAATLRPVREHIVDHPAEVDALLAELDGAGIAFDMTDQVKTMPRGFADHDDHPHVELLRCTQLIAMRPLPMTCWLDDTIVERIVDAAPAFASLYDFFDEAEAG